MKVTLYRFQNEEWIADSEHSADLKKVPLVFCFGGKDVIAQDDIYTCIRGKFPTADISMCSTAGEISNRNVFDKSLVAIAFEFNSTTIGCRSVSVSDFNDSYEAALALAGQIEKNNLRNVVVFSDGSVVNGSELVRGLNKYFGEDILVTGGLAGDDENFHSTLVGLNEQPTEGKIIAIAFYGDKLLVTHGSMGGWEMFGLEKEITKSRGNVLYEINNENALDLYKKYLGPDVQNLPGSSLRFPLSVRVAGATKSVVRTILSIDEENKCMTFAGDLPAGAKVRLMKGNFDKITAAAATAALLTMHNIEVKPDFALLISCVGRKMVLGQRIEEEIEAVGESFENQTTMAGFYSYGEISPFNDGGRCQLHNQTMTITSFYELP